MESYRTLRYLAPNLITTVGLVFGMFALVAIHENRFVDAGWLIIYSVLTDKVDGFVARLVRGTSELGVQLDSFADFLNFGIAPAYLLYCALENMFTGGERYLLMFACGLWLLAATFRLARYNITPPSDSGATNKIFFGVPTTLMGGVVIGAFLAATKYALPPGQGFGGVRLFGSWITPEWVWHSFPYLVIVGAFLMASSLRMPKLGIMSSKSGTIFIFINVFFGYIFGFARMFPEYLVWPPTMWVVFFLIWGQLSPAARAMKPPPIFPPVDPPPGHEPIRPEDDLLPEGADITLDEPA